MPAAPGLDPPRDCPVTVRSPHPPPRPRVTRSDAFPEGLDPRDTGCSLHPSCLRCPEPACRYDCSHGRATLRALALARRIITLKGLGYGPYAIASAVGCSLRTVYRLLSAAGSLDPSPSTTRRKTLKKSERP